MAVKSAEWIGRLCIRVRIMGAVEHRNRQHCSNQRREVTLNAVAWVCVHPVETVGLDLTVVGRRRFEHAETAWEQMVDRVLPPLTGSGSGCGRRVLEHDDDLTPSYLSARKRHGRGWISGLARTRAVAVITRG